MSDKEKAAAEAEAARQRVLAEEAERNRRLADQVENERDRGSRDR
jgi:hypothetical protein